MHTEKHHEMEQSVVTRFLIAGGAIGPPLFIIVLLIEGATRPGYSAWHNYGSSLSLSNQGWMQIANFLVCGLLTLCFAIGLRFSSDPCEFFRIGNDANRLNLPLLHINGQDGECLTASADDQGGLTVDFP